MCKMDIKIAFGKKRGNVARAVTPTKNMTRCDEAMERTTESNTIFVMYHDDYDINSLHHMIINKLISNTM